MLTELQKTELEDLVRINFRVARIISPTRSKVVVTWTDFGIADVDDSPNKHEITVREDGDPMPGFPQIFNDDEAFDVRYSVQIDDWDTNKSHEITVTVNEDFQKILFIPEFKRIKPLIVTPSFRATDVAVELKNIEDGILVKLITTHPEFRNRVKNVLIKRAVGLGALEDKYQTSVPVSFTISNVNTDYNFIFEGGEEKAASPTGLADIYDNRVDFVARVRYDDSETDNYIEETNPNIFENFDPLKVVTKPTFLTLDPLIDNEFDFLYFITETEKFFRFQPDDVLLPFQAPSTDTRIVTKYVVLTDIDPNTDGTFDLFVDGTLSNTSGVIINGAIRRENGDFTSFDKIITLTPPIDSFLPAGVSFMRGYDHHIDTDVIEDNFYTYEVEIQTWTNEVVTVFSGIKRREIPDIDQVVPSSLILENLEESLVGKESISEFDFQSGVSHGGMKVFLSDSEKDFRDFRRNQKILEEGCR